MRCHWNHVMIINFNGKVSTVIRKIIHARRVCKLKIITCMICIFNTI